MEYNEITKSEFRNLYNIDKVLVAKNDIMKYLKTYNENKQAVAFGVRKQPRDTAPTWFKEYTLKQDKFNKTVLTRLNSLEDLVLKIVKLNNLRAK